MAWRGVDWRGARRVARGARRVQRCACMWRVSRGVCRARVVPVCTCVDKRQIMHVCMYMYMHMSLYKCYHVCIHSCVAYVHVCVCGYVYIHTNMFVLTDGVCVYGRWCVRYRGRMRACACVCGCAG